MSSAEAAETKNKAIKERIWSADFILISLVSAIISICYQFHTIAMPLYIQTLGGSKTIAGLSITFFTIATLLSRPFIGRIIDKTGRWKTFIIGTVFYIIASFLYGVLVVLPFLMFVRIIHGAAFSASSTTTATMITDVLPETRMLEGISYFGLINIVSVSLSPMVALFIINGYSFKTLFYIATILSISAMIISFFIRSEKKRITKIERYTDVQNEQIQLESSQITGWEKIIARNALFPALTAFCFAFATTSVGIFLTTLAKTYNISDIGMFFTIQAVSMTLSRLFVGRLTKRFGSTLIVITSLFMLTFVLTGIFFFRSLEIILILAVIYGFGTGFILPTLNTMAISNCTPYRRGASNATYYMSLDLGIALGAIAWGIVADISGIAYVFLFAGMIPLAAVFLFLGLKKKMYIAPIDNITAAE